MRQYLIKEIALVLKESLSNLIIDNNFMKLLKPLLVNSIFLKSFNILLKVSSIIFFVDGFWYISIIRYCLKNIEENNYQTKKLTFLNK